jgi:ubiquinone/menaquinone biosynthesis C-methylase UbiE
LTCEECGAVILESDGIIDFVQDAARSTLDDIDYDKFYSISELNARTAIAQWKTSAGSRWPADLGCCIEIGAGTGGATMGLVAGAPFQHLVISDISLKMLRQCRVNLKKANLLRPYDMTFITYGATQKCFRPASFDSAIGSAVIHHITDVAAFLGDLAQILKPTGVAIFVEPSLPFHRAIVAMLADIVAQLIAEGVPCADPNIVYMCNWISEIRCNLLHQGDLEFLATREDKHMFSRPQITHLAQSAGFAQVAVTAHGLDASGEETLRIYLAQCKVAATMIDRVCAALPMYFQKYMAVLDPEDQSPSYLIYFSKNNSFPGNEVPLEIPAIPSKQNDEQLGPAVHCYLTVQIADEVAQRAVTVDGWCFSSTDLVWLVMDLDGTTQRFPIWLPRPDVQPVMNADRKVPPVNVLCSGVVGRVLLDRSTDVFDIALAVTTADEVSIPLGGVTLTGRQPKATVIQ